MDKSECLSLVACLWTLVYKVLSVRLWGDEEQYDLAAANSCNIMKLMLKCSIIQWQGLHNVGATD